MLLMPLPTIGWSHCQQPSAAYFVAVCCTCCILVRIFGEKRRKKKTGEKSCWRCRDWQSLAAQSESFQRELSCLNRLGMLWETISKHIEKHSRTAEKSFGDISRRIHSFIHSHFARPCRRGRFLKTSKRCCKHTRSACTSSIIDFSLLAFWPRLDRLLMWYLVH